MNKFLFLLILFLSLPSKGQENYNLIFSNDSYKKIIKNTKDKFKDSTDAIKYLKQIQINGIKKGFLLTSIDSIKFNEKTILVDLITGPKFYSCKLNIDQDEFVFLRKHININEKLILNTPFTPSEVTQILISTLNAYTNNGFPFAKVRLKNPIIKKNKLIAEIEVTRGPYYSWNKINIKGDSSISNKYISNLIGIKIGQHYKESSRKKISECIEQIAFLKEIKPSEILFTSKGVELFLYLKSIPTNTINGIIGFQPDPISEKILFTGELNLRLQNIFNRGELINIKWQSIQVQTQSLDANLNYPFLFNSSFGLDGTFNLYKRDTSFLELKSKIGIQYFLKSGSYIKAYYQNINSNILSGGNNNPSFSKLGNTNSNSYGISYSYQNIDYIPNPSKGIKILIESNIGARKSRINNNTIINSIIYQMKLNMEYFIPIYKRHILYLSNLTEHYSADEIFENEVYRYGGLSNQRGFNEDELYATTKTTTTIEYRFLLDKNSNVFAFYDQSWYENNSSSYYQDFPFGFGLGFSFRTELGIFSISYALGKQFDNPILFRNSKIHFGYNFYF